MRRFLSSIGLALLPALAHAHGAADSPSEELPVILPLAVTLIWYGIGAARLAARGDIRAHLPQITMFGAGWLILAAALLGPLHDLSERSFTAHMIEHELLMLIAAPFLALSRPIGIFLWALPPRARTGIAGTARAQPFSLVWKFITAPGIATILQIVALWIWHAPALFDRALESEGWHAAQHASFIFSALIFWWAIVRHGHGTRRAAAAALWLFITSTASGALGALMAFSQSPWYEGYRQLASGALLPGGLTAVEDQQLAGLIMWIPGGLVHFGAALWFAMRALRGSEADAREMPA